MEYLLTPPGRLGDMEDPKRIDGNTSSQEVRMNRELTATELMTLIEKVFHIQSTDKSLAILVDLPDGQTADTPDWKERRHLAANWSRILQKTTGHQPLSVHLVVYRNVGRGNADLPESAWIVAPDRLPATADELRSSESIPFERLFQATPIWLAPTQFSATAPLKVAAKKFGFRAATMPGFRLDMVDALRLDYSEVHRRVQRLTGLLDRAENAFALFEVDHHERRELVLDLRFRTAHASSGILQEPGTAGNLPSGEAYIVPYEGEREGTPSRSRGALPVQLGPEVVTFEIENNRALHVLGDGPAALEQRAYLQKEPAYGNLAELGLGVLSELGVKPCGEILLDEKLGLHIAFGRSEHFGGQVGPGQFSRPEAVVHIDRVYLPSLQPRVEVQALDLELEGGERVAIMRNGKYVIEF